MGNPKQKWTAEEEEALKAGVAKHGAGKWKLIQKDPDFHPFLHSRSNIDLKDKWRNMAAADQGRSREKSRTPKPKSNQDALALSVNIQTPVTPVTPVTPAPLPPVIHELPPVLVKEEPAKDFPEGKNGPRYNDLIFEALSGDESGMDLGSIMSYIEHRVIIEAPQNFRKGLGSRLRRLLAQERLEKVGNMYRIKKKSLVERKGVFPRQLPSSSHSKLSETLEEAAKTAAYKVAEAEEKQFHAVNYVKDAERAAEMAEETDTILQFVKEIYDICHSTSSGIVELAA